MIWSLRLLCPLALCKVDHLERWNTEMEDFCMQDSRTTARGSSRVTMTLQYNTIMFCICSPAEIQFAHPDHTIAGIDDAANSLI